MDYDDIVRDAITLKSLTDLYTTIAGVTSGYISVCKKVGMTEKEAQERLYEIDKAARDKVDAAYKIVQKRHEEEDEWNT